jgi:hypothetical protein
VGEVKTVNVISRKLENVSRGWVVLTAVVVFLAFGAFILPQEAERAEQISGGAGSPDTTLFYNARQLYSIAEAYGPEGRAAYVRARYTFDVAFPLVYGFFLVTLISWFSMKVIPNENALRLMNLVPVIGVLFDFLENISTSLVMLRYPERTPFVAQMAPILSLIKWIFVYGSFLVLGVLVAVWLFITIRKAVGARNT